MNAGYWHNATPHVWAEITEHARWISASGKSRQSGPPDGVAWRAQAVLAR